MNWLNQLFAKKTSRPIRKSRPRRCGPRLEVLEDRLAPATFVVTNTADTPVVFGSLPWAVVQANNNLGDDEITFNDAVFGQTITLTKTLILSGNSGATKTTGPGADLLTVSGGNKVGVFSISSGVVALSSGVVALSGLTIANGWNTNVGGGIFNAKGDVTISDCSLRFNTSSYGGAIYNQGGRVTISNSMLSGNTAFSSGDGGAIFSTFGGTVTIRNSALLSNSASGEGGGIYIEPGPNFFADSNTVTVSASTLSSNVASLGGGIFINIGGLSSPPAKVTVSGSTLSNNTAFSVGGGINNAGGLLQLRSSIVGGNHAHGHSPDVFGAVASQGHNLVQDPAFSIGYHPTDLLGIDPQLEPLNYYGGPTPTYALQPGSPALDRGDDGLATPGATDQRGLPRLAGAHVDIGAFEVEQPNQPPNQPPSDIHLDNSSVNENEFPDAMVGRFTTTDVDSSDSFTYSLVSGAADNGSFTIVGDQLQTLTIFDYEAKPSYSILVRSTDSGGLSIDKPFTIYVIDVNEGPTVIALSTSSVAENQSVGTPVGTFRTIDPDTGDSFTYSLVSGPGDDNNGAFAIVGDQLRTAASFDYEAQSSYSILVRSTDSGGQWTEEAFTISVTDVNESSAQVVAGNLQVIGSESADSIMISGFGTDLTVTINGVPAGNPAGGTTFTISPTGHVVLHGGSGDDVLVAMVNVPVEVHGGAGNDTIQTGFGHDVIWGGLGDDTIFGQFGNDVLIGGAGRDVLYGQNGNDLLFGGELNGTHNGVDPYDFATLRAISAAWATGIADDDLASSLADDLDDTEQDTLFGGGGQDWLLGNLTGPNVDLAPDFLLNHDKKTSL